MPMASARVTIPRRGGLFERTGFGVPQIVAGAGRAEFGDDDPFSRKLVAQELVHGDRLVDSVCVKFSQ